MVIYPELRDMKVVWATAGKPFADQRPFRAGNGGSISYEANPLKRNEIFQRNP